MTWDPSFQRRRSKTWVDDIEHQTKQTLSIITELTDQNLEKCNPQWQSPLYQLPKEIRDLIFLYASTQSPDPHNTYNSTAYYYRPGHTAKLKTDTSFLLTCRKVWLEANHLPMQLAEHAFWFQRGPYDVEPDKRWPVNVRREQHRYENSLRSMTKANLSNLTYIHFFMQMFQAEQFQHHFIWDTFFSREQMLRGFNPKVFHITIRHSDWDQWEVDRQLFLSEPWVQAVLDHPSLGAVDEFRLELEAWESKKDQLNPIVERLRTIEGKPKLANALDSKCNAASKFVVKSLPEVDQWTRSPLLLDQEWPVFKDVSTLNLHSVTIRWRAEYQSSNGLNGSQPSPSTASNPSLFFPRPQQSLRSFSMVPTAYHHAQLSFRQAEAVEHGRRDRFERWMGDIEAQKLAKEWEATGSLLKLDNNGYRDRTGLVNTRPNLNWLNKFKV